MEFSPSEVRNLIKMHRALFVNITDISCALEDEKKWIKLTVDNLSRIQKRENGLIKLSGNDHSVYMLMLLRQLSAYLRIEETWETVNQLDRLNHGKIDIAIREANYISGGLRRLFQTSITRKRANESCQYLQTLLEGEYRKLIENAHDVVYAVREETKERNDFSEDEVNECSRMLENLWHGTVYPDDYPEEIPAVRDRLIELANLMKTIPDSDEQYTTSIRVHAQDLRRSEAVKQLKSLPIEEINRERLGIRTALLRDHGYQSVADICAASVYQLRIIKGISEDSANQIINIAKKIATQIESNCKIRLSADDNRVAAQQLIRSIAAYIILNKASEERTVLQEKKKRISDGFVRTERVTTAYKWIFSDADTKERAKEGLASLKENDNPEIYDLAKKVQGAFSSAQNIQLLEAYKMFSVDPIGFATTLEQVVPELCENDSFFGLPEELARAVEDQCYFPEGLKCTLRRYQEWGVKYILHQERVLLGDEMGLGKTVQAIATMVSLRNTGATHFLVVCPASVLTNWAKEVEKHSKLRVIQVYGATRKNALDEWTRMGGVAVTTYETTANISFEETFRYSLLVVDEAHYIKNPEANRTINVKRIGNYAERMLFMTGTPLENNVDEMIALMELLQPKVAASAKGVSYVTAANEFRKRIAPVYYRRKRTDVIKELPEMIEIEDWCRLTTDEEKRYEESILERKYNDARRVSWNVDDWRKSSKALRIREIVEDAKVDGRKVLVFSFFLNTIKMVCEMLGEQAMPPINGAINPVRRQEIIDDFEKSDPGTVLPAQIQAGGTGLNIQSASVVVICEPQFKPSIENQAISRAYRMGQSRNVLVHRLLCENTVDEKLMQVLADKQRLFDAFADESVAAKESLEIDTKTFGDIVTEEIDRINKKNGYSGNKVYDIPEITVNMKKSFNGVAVEKKTNTAGNTRVSDSETMSTHATPIQRTPRKTVYAAGLTDMLLSYGIEYDDRRSKGGTVWINDSTLFEKLRKTIEEQCHCSFAHPMHGDAKSWYLRKP